MLRNYQPSHDEQIHVECIPLSDSNAAGPTYEQFDESEKDRQFRADQEPSVPSIKDRNF